jgi:hypothetical protein
MACCQPHDPLLHNFRIATFPYFCRAVDLLTCSSCAAVLHRTRPVRRRSANRYKSQRQKDEGFMDTHLMIGVAVMFGLIGIAASRDLLRRLREQQPQLVPVKVERPDLQGQRRDR